MSTPPPHEPQGPQDNPFRAPEPGRAPVAAPAPQGWGQGWAPGPYRPARQVNGVAISALVLGALCFLPAVGIVLGIIALVQIKRRGERGRAMAVIGIVLSSLGLALWLVALTTDVARDAVRAIEDAADTTTVSALDTGDCFDLPPGDTIGDDVYDVDEADCERPHDAEIFGIVPVSGDEFPGRAKLREVGNDQCYDLKRRYTMDPWAVPDDTDWYTLLPERDGWEAGDRAITCVYAHADLGGSLLGSLRRDETTLDDDQIAFLTAMSAIDDALYAEPEEYPEEDLAANTAWAAEVRDALGQQLTALQARSWSGAQTSVDLLLRDLREARESWRKAAAADDADAYYEAYDAGYAFVDGTTTIGARSALGLAVTVPSDGEDGGRLDV
ncbi:DUF4190 domain-containing protein [Streptomyces niveiscabiei]|uniref:DUF4190 domain-containing protein n=1 Tax=Streptomyces niveiscabiei TaxID=164115 RepID=UPI0029B64220|nr:DUF4190 domain-containing protein [Streptomyces niveiscabiei]MDX3384806.1 DUF4190 domain-containing protein [Streptomyces niveiscabiei]